MGPIRSRPSNVREPQPPTWLPRLFFGLVAFSLLGSLLERLTGLAPGWIAPIASLLTLATGVAAAFAPVVVALGRPAWFALALVVVIGAASELIGLATGLPFGRYVYTEAWWPTVPLPGGGVFPVQLPFAWFLIAGSSYLVVAQWVRPPVLRVVLGAALAALVDVPMEPVMTETLGYWRWLEPGPLPGGAPWLNPVGWFLTSLLAGLVLERAGAAEVRTRTPLAVLAAFLVLVIGLGLIRG